MFEGFQFLLILGGGLLLGLAARLALPGDQEISWSETIVVGIAGAGIGGIAINLFLEPENPLRFGVATAIAGFAGSVLVLAGLVYWRRRKVRGRSVQEIIAAGESDSVEFKQTSRHNIHTNNRDSKLELAIAKTVAGFLNGNGGTLLIGVTDDGEITGIAPDLKYMKEPDLDRYELWLHDYLGGRLGTTALTDVDISFETVGTATVTRVAVEPSERPVFLDEPGGGRSADFYVRLGNSTRQLRTDEVLDYEKSRWG